MLFRCVLGHLSAQCLYQARRTAVCISPQNPWNLGHYKLKYNYLAYICFADVFLIYFFTLFF